MINEWNPKREYFDTTIRVFFTRMTNTANRVDFIDENHCRWTKDQNYLRKRNVNSEEKGNKNDKLFPWAIAWSNNSRISFSLCPLQEEIRSEEETWKGEIYHLKINEVWMPDRARNEFAWRSLETELIFLDFRINCQNEDKVSLCQEDQTAELLSKVSDRNSWTIPGREEGRRGLLEGRSWPKFENIMTMKNVKSLIPHPDQRCPRNLVIRRV